MYGIDYEETFGPLPRPKITVIIVDALKAWTLHQIDVKNAFLHDELQKEVQLEQPHGYEDVVTQSMYASLMPYTTGVPGFCMVNADY